MKHEPAGEARPQLSSLQPLAPESRETQQGAERQCRRLREAAVEVTLQEYGIAALWWNLAILLCLLTRTVLKQALEIERLGSRLDTEIEKRDRRKR